MRSNALLALNCVTRYDTQGISGLFNSAASDTRHCRAVLPVAGAWHVIDFGLARRYVDDGGMVLPARPDAAFRGSTTYASLAAHNGEDLGATLDLR